VKGEGTLSTSTITSRCTRALALPAALTGLACALIAPAAQAQQTPRLELLAPLPQEAVTEDALRYLADKAGLGIGPDERELLRIGRDQGIEAAVAELMRSKPERCNAAGAAAIPGLGEGECLDGFVERQLAVVNGTQNSDERRRTLENLTAFRFVNSANTYEQRMFAHLLGLFTTTMAPENLRNKAAEMSSYVEMLRGAARGNTDLVELAKAVTVHPMMLNFLSGNGSKAPQPNENYGREFMGLMSIGVEDLDGNLNYTDDDVVESSKAYTGFVVEGREARFVPENFITGPKVLFRGTDHECTAVTADDAVTCAFQHPNAPIHCAQELLTSFVTPSPSRALVEELAGVCAANDFQLRPVMQILLASQAFFDQAHVDAIPKQCFEVVAGMARTTGFPFTFENVGPALARCNDGNVLSSPGALFFPVDAPTSPLTKIDVTDVVARNLSGPERFDMDPAVAMNKVEQALFTDKGITLADPGTRAFESCMTELGLAATLSEAQQERYEQLFDPAQFDAGTREQKLSAMLGCYRRFLLSTEYVTH
jgi:uncharacterized protein (DUF1800 family)